MIFWKILNACKEYRIITLSFHINIEGISGSNTSGWRYYEFLSGKCLKNMPLFDFQELLVRNWLSRAPSSKYMLLFIIFKKMCAHSFKGHFCYFHKAFNLSDDNTRKPNLIYQLLTVLLSLFPFSITFFAVLLFTLEVKYLVSF